MSDDLEKQLRVLFKLNAKFSTIITRNTLSLFFKDIEAQYASSNDSSDLEDEEILETEADQEVTEKTELEISANEGSEENPSNENEGAVASDSASDKSYEEELDLYCPACKKSFKTVKS